MKKLAYICFSLLCFPFLQACDSDVSFEYGYTDYGTGWHRGYDWDYPRYRPGYDWDYRRGHGGGRYDRGGRGHGHGGGYDRGGRGHGHGGGYDRGGRGHGHGGGYDRGGRGHGGRGHNLNYLMVENTAAPAMAAEAQDSASLLARNYDLKSSTAKKIIALAGGENRQAAIEAMKLNSDELAVIARFDMPAPSTVRKISAALGEDSGKITRVLRDFLTDVKPQTETECHSQFNCAK